MIRRYRDRLLAFDHERDASNSDDSAALRDGDAGIESNDLGAPQLLRDMLANADSRYRVGGTHEVVAGLEGPDGAYALTAALLRRGYSSANVALVVEGNWERVLGSIWRA